MRWSWGRCSSPRQYAPAPVRAGDVQQLERAQPAAGGHVRPETQVGPPVVPVHGHPIAQRALALVERLDDLPLVRLVRKALQGVLVRQVLAHERLVELHQLGHPLLDAREVLGRQRLGEVEVVVEAVLDRGSDRVLRPREQVAHRLGHDVRRGMAEDVQPVGLPHRDRAHGPIIGRDEPQVDQRPVEPRGDGVRGQELCDRFPLGKVDRAPVRQLQLRHQAAMISARVRASRVVGAAGFEPATSRV